MNSVNERAQTTFTAELETTSELPRLPTNERCTWSEPDMGLVNDDRAPASMLDDDALPASWESWISSEAEACGCPRDYVAAGLIGASSAWIGNSRRIAATAAWAEPAHLWMVLIGAPSAGKTPALQPMIQASLELERDAGPQQREALAQYERNAEAAGAMHEQSPYAVRATANEGNALPDLPAGAEQPSPTPLARMLVMDTSTEELQRILAESPRGLLYARDELAGWLAGFGRYGSAGADRAFFLEAWNGGTYVCDRVKYHGSPVRIEHASLAIIGGMVPDRLRGVLVGADDGLAERLIYVWPDPRRISPLVDLGVAEATHRRNVLSATARKLRNLPTGTDNRGNLTPRVLELDGDARQIFDDLRCDAMKRAQNVSGLPGAWAGKNPGRALRLALDFELLAWTARDDREPTRVSADSVARAGRYLAYASGMLDRVVAGLSIGRADADAAVLARHLMMGCLAEINERRLYQTAGFSWARDARRRASAFAVLEAAGWVRRKVAPAQGRPRDDWEVSPRIAEATR